MERTNTTVDANFPRMVQTEVKTHPHELKVFQVEGVGVVRCRVSMAAWGKETQATQAMLEYSKANPSPSN